MLPPGKLTWIKLATVHAQKLHIFWRYLSWSSFCPFVACLLIALETILFIEANAITGHSTCFGHRMFRVPTRQCPAHRAKETVALLTTDTPDFIPPTLWPPNSLDLNPVDYCVWSVLQERVYYCISGRLKTAHRGWMGSFWSQHHRVGHCSVASATACVRAAGGHFEHCLQWHYLLFM